MSGVCPQSCRAEGIPAAVKAGEAERREKPGGSISSWTPDVPGLSLDVSGGLWEAEDGASKKNEIVSEGVNLWKMYC